MKRNNPYLKVWMIAGTCCLTACTESILDKAAGPESAQAVSFGIAGEETRGAQLTNDALTDMGVFASMNLNDYDPATATCSFMYNQHVSRSGGVWSYSPVKKWPQIEGVSFFAYAPYQADGSLLTFRPQEEAGLPRFTYTVPADVSRQIDLLVSDPLFDQYYYLTPSVKFGFNHALSCVGFAARKADDFPAGISIEVTSVTVSGLIVQGTLPVDIRKTLRWKPADGVTGSCALTTANGALRPVPLTGTAQSISSDTEKFMPLPQQVGPEVMLGVRARYTRNGITEDVVFESRLSESLARLDPGKRYVLNLILSITQVVVDFEIIPWDRTETDIPSFD